MSLTRGSKALAILLVALIAGVAAGCGSNDSSSDETVSAERQGAAEFVPLKGQATAAELEKRVASYTAPATDLLVTEPVSKKAEPDKEIAALVCGFPICSQFADGMEEAADKLGWKLTRISLGTTPEQFAAAFDRAASLDVDMVVGSGLSREQIAPGLAKLNAADIPYVGFAAPLNTGNGVEWAMINEPYYRESGYITSEFIALDSDFDAKVVLYNVETYPNLTAYSDVIRDYLPKICDDCTVDYKAQAVTDVGTNMPSIVTGYVKAHPDTNYVVCSFGDLCAGVGRALKDAGLNDVKIVTRDPSATNFAGIASGLEYAGLPLPIHQTGWQVIDAAQRVFNGDPLEQTFLSPVRVVTKDQVKNPDDLDIGAVTNYQAQYEKLWEGQ